MIGPRGDIVDDDGHVYNAYALNNGDWVLIRPDGYVSAIIADGEIAALENYLRTVGLGLCTQELS